MTCTAHELADFVELVRPYKLLPVGGSGLGLGAIYSIQIKRKDAKWGKRWEYSNLSPELFYEAYKLGLLEMVERTFGKTYFIVKESK